MNEKASHVDILEKSILKQRMANTKAQRWNCARNVPEQQGGQREWGKGERILYKDGYYSLSLFTVKSSAYETMSST